MGRRIENASEGITLQIEKKAETTGALNAYMYLMMDAQLNIQNDAYISALYQVTKNVYERTTYCIVRSSNWSRQNAEPDNQLYYLIEKISKLLAGSKTLFFIDDVIADEVLNKRRQPLLELVISGRHRGHSLWLLTQSYTAVPNNIRRQAKMLYIWYPKN